MTNKPSLMASLKRDLDKIEKNSNKSNQSESTGEKITKSNFIRMTITMPPDLLLRLKNHGAEQRALGKKHCDTSSLIRAAVSEYLSKNA